MCIVMPPPPECDGAGVGVGDGEGPGVPPLTVIRSKSGAQALGLEKVIVLAPAPSWTDVVSWPGVRQPPVLLKLIAVPAAPFTLMWAMRPASPSAYAIV